MSGERFQSIGEIERAHRAAGGDFFEPVTVELFCRVSFPEVYAGRYFITRDHAAGTDRFSIRCILDSGAIRTVGAAYGYESQRHATGALRSALAERIEVRFDPLADAAEPLPTEPDADPAAPIWRVYIGPLPLGAWERLSLKTATRIADELAV